jgi:hypothetical protein
LRIEDTQDVVFIDGGTLTTLAGARGGGSSANGRTASGARILIQNSSFDGGPFGINAVVTESFDAFWNTFTNQTGPAIRYVRAGGRSEGNTVEGCGSACINATFGGNDQVVEIIGNQLRPDAAIGTGSGIVVSRRAVDPPLTVVIEGNNIVGQGAIGSHPFESGILILGDIQATLNRNTISNAVVGLDFQSSVSSGSDNVIDDVGTGVRVDGSGTVAINGSDLTNYSIALEAAAGGADLTCNWWGTIAGPQGVDAGVAAAVYTPWAIAQVANGAGGACTGS